MADHVVPNSHLSVLRETFHKAVAGLIFGVITFGSLVTWPLYLISLLINFSWSSVPLPWTVVERARRRRAIRENLADLSSPYSRLGKAQVFHLSSVSIIPEAQKAALAHLDPKKAALGYRDVLEILEKKEEGSGKILQQFRLSEYKWLTLAEVDKQITLLEKAFRELGVEHGHRVLIFAETRIEWFLCAHAIIRTGAAIVTLYANLGEDGIKYGLEETKATMLVTSEALLPRLPLNWRLYGSRIHTVVYFPTLAKPTSKPGILEVWEVLNRGQVSFLSYSELLVLGTNFKGPESSLYSPSTTRITEETPAIILNTSGSTGKPKGVILTHGNFVHTLKAVFSGIITPEVMAAHDHHCWYSYLPLAHILEFIAENVIFCAGIKVGYGSAFTMTDLSTGTPKGQAGDLSLLQPTVIPGVPLVLERIRKAIFEKLNKHSPILRHLALWMVDYKTAWLEKGYETPLFDALICARFRALLGGRLEYMLIGGAQLSPETQRIMRALLNVRILVGYGSTETCGANLVMDLEDLSVGWTGAPLFGIQLRLVDWTEGGYTLSDKPYPRGEMHIGGGSVSVGYFEQDELTKEAFYKDKKGVQWFRTGDIAEVDPGTGFVRIIDRRKDLVKMENGEYVSLGKIESELKNCLLVDNVCVHGDSKHPYLVALIMPNWKVIRGLAVAFLAEQDRKKAANDGTLDTRSQLVRTASKLEPDIVEDLRTDPAFVALVLAELQTFCRQDSALSRIETPARIYLAKEEWSPANDLLTAALKIKRANLLRFYAPQVAQMYEASLAR